MRDLRDSHQILFLALVVCASALVGCDDAEKRKAIEDAERSRKSLNRAEARLTRAQKEIADLEELLGAITEQRDTLEAQVRGLLEDRGRAVAAAEEAQDGIRSLTDRSTMETKNVTTLQSQISELTSIIQSQEETIAAQEATIEELLKTVEAQQQSIEEQYGDQEEVEDVNVSGPD